MSHQTKLEEQVEKVIDAILDQATSGTHIVYSVDIELGEKPKVKVVIIDTILQQATEFLMEE